MIGEMSMFYSSEGGNCQVANSSLPRSDNRLLNGKINRNDKLESLFLRGPTNS
ncbi:hypothetical protein HanIR_Chr14g0723291 [Helianthus annuus]|nr:hypothetical protein HanIR_Chr14g0723291 [Helianthus annuus]